MEKKLKSGRKPVPKDEKKLPVSVYINKVEKTYLVNKYGSINNAIKSLIHENK